MSANERTVNPLTQAVRVDVAAIERELEELWRSAAQTEGGAVLHAEAFTLIYALRDGSDGGTADELLADLTAAHPARSILLHLGDENAPDSEEAWVTASCHRASPADQRICSDYITLRTTGESYETVASTLMSLFLSGLPVVLIWDHSLPPDHPLLTMLGKRIERVILSVIPPCGPASSLHGFFEIVDRLGRNPLVTDLSECFLRSWQLAIAALFDADPTSTGNIRTIRLHYSGDKVPAEMLLLASWMSVALKWTPERVTLYGSHPALQFEGARVIEFCNEPTPEGEGYAELGLSGGEIRRCEEPMGDNRLREMLLMQLDIWGRDPLREAGMKRARIWQRELLFS
jgi:glucose-6-phosphate dehydrogenase assembly protein OpcA